MNLDYYPRHGTKPCVLGIVMLTGHRHVGQGFTHCVPHDSRGFVFDLDLVNVDCIVYIASDAVIIFNVLLGSMWKM
jgi:hypothetical protein